ncbi:MAG: double zinc ribbon domain-containing protein [Ktedonobacteraceae bacterium]
MSKGSLRREVQRITQQGLDLLFPPQCAGCKRHGHVLCPACSAAIQPLAPPYCQRCGIPLAAGDTCRQCSFHIPALSGVRTYSRFAEPLRSCIYSLKYEGNTRLAQPLGLLLARAYLHYALQTDAITAVPLDNKRQEQRGYNHAYLLAKVCAARLHLPLYSTMLVRHRTTVAQVELSASERHQNVAGAFRCTPAFTTGALLGRRILIIDDVCTTGATLEACAAPLFAAGAREVWALVLARPSSE